MANVKIEKTKKIVLKDIAYDEISKSFIDEDGNHYNLNSVLHKIYGNQMFTLQTVLKESNEEPLDTDEV